MARLPISDVFPHPADLTQRGLTTRELFAGLALHALLSTGRYGVVSPEDVAEKARQYADALLHEVAGPADPGAQP